MPLTLDSTRALRGDRRKWTLLVRDHGRYEYLTRTVAAMDEVIGLDFFDRLVLSEDGCEGPDTPMFDGWEKLSTGSERQGLTANVAQAWGALTDADEWVFNMEGDFVLHDAPLDAMAAVLEANRDVANIVLARQPVGPDEVAAGSVLRTIQGLHDEGGWCSHRRGFWLNPFVSHSSLLRSLTPGVETLLTEQCLSRGYKFAYWGGREDPPRCTHIGEEGGMWSPGWKV